jgi:hypothetical protein
MTTYANKYRPVSFCTLPDGIEWEYVENPKGSNYPNGLPESTLYQHGVIKTNRPMTAEEIETFQYTVV